MYELYSHQEKALLNMHNGCILNGGTGSGKSRTSLAYYDKVTNRNVPLFIITTAKKRDSGEWEDELLIFADRMPAYVIDSWNNIKKYKFIVDAFFIFDEDKITGRGAWVKAFLRIAKYNRFIVLSATPGDCWDDYIPIFIANGFYNTFKEFDLKHVVRNPYVQYRKVDNYLHTSYLSGLRRKILVEMDFERKTVQHHEDIYCSYPVKDYKRVSKDRWDMFKDEPIQTGAAYGYCLRRVVNSDPDRVNQVVRIWRDKRRIIVFYNFDYELELLEAAFACEPCATAQWNGHKHQEIPTGTDDWVYFVQYNSGSEGWNCIRTDTVVFYSQSYSYKQTKQAAGRIDRLNTPYTDLYLYHLKSRSGIDLAISRSLSNKRDFNASAYFGKKFDKVNEN